MIDAALVFEQGIDNGLAAVPEVETEDGIGLRPADLAVDGRTLDMHRRVLRIKPGNHLRREKVAQQPAGAAGEIVTWRLVQGRRDSTSCGKCLSVKCEKICTKPARRQKFEQIYSAAITSDFTVIRALCCTRESLLAILPCRQAALSLFPDQPLCSCATFSGHDTEPRTPAGSLITRQGVAEPAVALKTGARN